MTPSSKIWTELKKLELSSKDSPIAYGKEEIIYGFLNIVRKWNWRTDKQQEYFLRIGIITALAELQNGNLIVGNNKGKIHVYDYMKNSYSIIVDSGKKIIEILVVGTNHVIVKLDNKRQYLVDVKEKYCLKSFNKRFHVFALKVNFIVLSNGKSVRIENVTEFGRIVRKLDKSHLSMKTLNGRFVILYSLSNRVIIWDECDSNIIFDEKLDRIYDGDEFVLSINQDTFIFPFFNNFGVFLKQITRNNRNWSYRDFPKAGFYKITGIACLGNYIVYSTKTKCSGVHLFKKNGTLISSTMDFTDDGKSDPESLTVLNDSCIAIKIKDSIRVIEIKRRYKKRLFLGEGDFSYTEALIEKHKYTHPRLSEVITSTEILIPKNNEIERRTNFLRTLKVNVQYGIDAQKIHELFSKADQFKRIHWNCPYGDSADEMSKGNFKKVLTNFFNSSSKIQKFGDRIHVTLLQKDNNEFWQKNTGIVNAACSNAYSLIRKRFFGTKRYPGYTHKTTSGLDYIDDPGSKKREFVFEKRDFDSLYTIHKLHDIKKEYDGDYCYVCSTDSDSSNYDDDDDDDLEIEHKELFHQLIESN